MRQRDIKRIADEIGVPITTIDKDWVLGHFLNVMFFFEDIQHNFVFKGGTALKKCYIEDYRFSEDLDFTLLDSSFLVDKNLINRIIKEAEKKSGAKFHFDNIKNQIHKDVAQGYEVIIKFWGADHKPNQKPLPANRWLTKIKLDISFSEKLIQKPVKKNIIHFYSDKNKIISEVSVYSFSEIVAEKLRELVQRNRPRDVYDNWYFSKIIEEENYSEIKELLILKAKNKAIDISKIENFVNEKKRNSNKRAWESSLKHQISAEQLPDFENAYNSLAAFIEKILSS